MKSITVSLLAVVITFEGVIAASAASGVPKDYPLKKCVVSDEALGEHGKPVKVTHEGTDVWLCCKSCMKDFKKEPAKFTKMVKNAEAKK